MKFWITQDKKKKNKNQQTYLMVIALYVSKYIHLSVACIVIPKVI